jgi:hypothetical protein
LVPEGVPALLSSLLVSALAVLAGLFVPENWAKGYKPFYKFNLRMFVMS